MSTTSPTRAGRREWIALAALCLPMLIVAMDVSVLFFAVPFIAEDLQPSATQQLWIFDIYGFVLAGLLLTMGALGDRIGRRRLLLMGVAAFSVASGLAAWSTSAEMLIAARALMGVGGATLMPSTLALVRTVFHDRTQRAKAVGIWSAVMAGGVGLGPVLSGVLLEHFWWGSVFLINVPVMLLLLLVAPRLLPESRATSPGRLDLLSTALVLASVLPFIYGVKELAADGWSVRAVVAVVVGTTVGWLFVQRQRTAAHPLLDLDLLRRPGLRGSVAVNVIAQAGLVGNAILLTQYLQQVLDKGPLEAALWSLAPSLVVGGVGPMAAGLAARFGRPHVMAVALCVAGVGFVSLLVTQADSPAWVCLIGATLAAGIVTVATLVTEYVVGTVPADRAGTISGFLKTSTELAGALGIAVLGSLLNAGYRHAFSLPAGVAPEHAGHASDTLAGALAVSQQVPGQAGEALAVAGRSAYMTGMHWGVIAAAVLMVIGVVVALTRLPRGLDPAADAEPAELAAR
ncbi:MFS transporter [Luteipulveratus halotolerans]|uniref:MFS transporter n=1 Tax=Luteipulveratus halotolerans TaxID=1631356 RepID=A0A0L6CM32_9MICO|nr:MFS transporter [Luteipulveratus halotolerans]KNX38807.1 MFS transporter [Luteipulveratus halotolerans]